LSVPEYVKKAVKDALSENSYIGMVLDVNMYKRVGKEDEVNVSDSGTEFKMKFTIPDVLLTDVDKSKTAYSVVRVYVNDDGKTVTENVDADIDGNTVSIDADTSSEYIIIFNDASPLSSGTKQDNGMTVATPGNEETTLSGTEAATSLQSTVKNDTKDDTSRNSSSDRFILLNLLLLLGTVLLTVLKMFKKDEHKFRIAAMANMLIAAAVYLFRFSTGAIRFADWWSIVFGILFVVSVYVYIHNSEDEQQNSK
jgi:uncharacterized membrane protein